MIGGEQADLSLHGGLVKAVYAYPSESDRLLALALSPRCKIMVKLGIARHSVNCYNRKLFGISEGTHVFTRSLMRIVLRVDRRVDRPVISRVKTNNDE